MKIITISREFGSGGRELGKRLAEHLGFNYFDREIINAIAEKGNLDAQYVEDVLDKGLYRDIPITFAHSIHTVPMITHTPHNVIYYQQKILRELPEKGDCVIVGRNADVILHDLDPLKMFVYADMDAKVLRCQHRAPEGERLTDKQMKKQIKRIDRARHRTHSYMSDIPWGDKRGYDLCVNTTNISIKEVSELLADYSTHWFEHRETKRG
ncbi:MAG: cytidylate kinase-like family protein [Clostridia bacterium]|nr:cytidylate kinase-like family protein [Clostridia bacterium]